MVRISAFRYLTDNIYFPSIPTPDSPRATDHIDTLSDSSLLECLPLTPCFSSHCISCSHCPVVILSPNGFCNKNKVNLKNVQQYIDKGLLNRAHSDAFFIYSQTSGSHVQVGICGALSIEDYQKGVIKKHELTIAEKADVDACNLFFDKMKNVDPVMVMYRRSEVISELVRRIMSSNEPILTATEDCDAHYIWAVSAYEDVIALQAAFSAVDAMYIADGHHRSAAAVRKNSSARHARFGHSKYILAAVFPDNQLRILPYNRCVTSIGSLRPNHFLRNVRKYFTMQHLTSGTDPTPRRIHEMSMFFEGEWFSLIPRDYAMREYADDVIGQLDPEILYRCLLRPVLGIECARSDKRLVYVCGNKGLVELERKVTSGEAQVSFLLHNVSVVEVMNVADMGQLLPPKLTQKKKKKKKKKKKTPCLLAIE